MARSTLLGGSLRNLFVCISFLCATVGICAAQDTTSTVLTAPTSAMLGTTATLTATVSNTQAGTPNGFPVGTLQFADNGVVIGQVAASQVGVTTTSSASFTSSILKVGSHPIVATFVPT